MVSAAVLLSSCAFALRGGFDLCVDVADRRRQLLHGGCLLGGTLGQRLGAGGNLLAAGVHLIGGGVDLEQRIAHGGGQPVHGLHEPGILSHIYLRTLAAGGKVASAHGGQLVFHVADDGAEGGGEVAQVIRQNADGVLGAICNGGVQIAGGDVPGGLGHLVQRLCDAVGHGQAQGHAGNGADGAHDDNDKVCDPHLPLSLFHAGKGTGLGVVVNGGERVAEIVGNGLIYPGQVRIALFRVVAGSIEVELFQMGGRFFQIRVYRLDFGAVPAGVAFVIPVQKFRHLLQKLILLFRAGNVILCCPGIVVQRCLQQIRPEQRRAPSALPGFIHHLKGGVIEGSQRFSHAVEHEDRHGAGHNHEPHDQQIRGQHSAPDFHFLEHLPFSFLNGSPGRFGRRADAVPASK